MTLKGSKWTNPERGTWYRKINIGPATNQWHKGKSGRIATD